MQRGVILKPSNNEKHWAYLGCSYWKVTVEWEGLDGAKKPFWLVPYAMQLHSLRENLNKFCFRFW